MDPYDEFRRMQSIYDEINRSQRIYRDFDLARRTLDPTLEEFQRQINSAQTFGKALGDAARTAEDYLNSPYHRLLRSVEHELRSGPLTALARRESVTAGLLSQPAYAEWNDALTAAAHQLATSYDLYRKSGVEGLAARLNQDNTFLQSLRAAASPVLSMLANELFGAAGGILRPALVEGFGAELLRNIARAEEAESEEEIVGFLRALLAWLISQARRLPGSPVSAQAILSIFLAIAPLVYSHYSDMQAEQRIKDDNRQHIEESENRVLRELGKTESRLLEELRARTPEESSRKEYVVLKRAKLRKGPGSEFEALLILPPNLFVEELQRDGEWSQIEFFDYVEGEVRNGWIATDLLLARADGDSMQ